MSDDNDNNELIMNNDTYQDQQPMLNISISAITESAKETVSNSITKETEEKEQQRKKMKMKKNNRLSAPPSLGSSSLSIFSSPDNSLSLSSSLLSTNNKNNTNIRVITRIRPLSNEEKDNGLYEIITPVLNTTDEELLSWDDDIDENNVAFSSIMSPSLQSKYDNTKKKKHENEKEPTTLPTSLTIGEKSNQQQKLFEFDAVLGPKISQKDVYNYTINSNGSIANTLLNGINTTIIAYGQTGSGKTFTMDGSNSQQSNTDGIITMHQGDTFYSPLKSPKAGNKKLRKSLLLKQKEKQEKEFLEKEDNLNNNIILNDNDGIIPRAIYDLFTNIKSNNIKITMTYIEIYNDEIRDLLSSTPESKQELELRDYGENNGIHIKNITTHTIKTINDAYHYINYGKQLRTTSSTTLNIFSSRSHSICTLYIDNLNNNTNSKLTLVDLAGSERLKKLQGLGDVSSQQKQEGISINTDLFTLAKVISALSSDNNKNDKRRRSSSSTLSSNSEKHHTHIPYRDSKLTRILRDSLGGNCNTTMIACLSPTNVVIDESLNTLRYAARTRTITNIVHSNTTRKKSSNAKEVMALKKENKLLKSKLDDISVRFSTLEEQLKQHLLLDDDNNDITAISTTAASSAAMNKETATSSLVQQLRSITESNYEDDNKENNGNNNNLSEDHNVPCNHTKSIDQQHPTPIKENACHSQEAEQVLVQNNIHIEQQLLLELTIQNQELQEQHTNKIKYIQSLQDKEGTLNELIQEKQSQYQKDIEILQNNVNILNQEKYNIQTNVDFLLQQKEILQTEIDILYNQNNDYYDTLLLKQQLREEKSNTSNNKIEIQKQKIAIQQLTKTLNNNTIQYKSQVSDYNKKINIESNKNKSLVKDNKLLRKEIKFLSDERLMLLSKLDKLQQQENHLVLCNNVEPSMNGVNNAVIDVKTSNNDHDIETSSVIRKHANKILTMAQRATKHKNKQTTNTTTATSTAANMPPLPTKKTTTTSFNTTKENSKKKLFSSTITTSSLLLSDQQSIISGDRSTTSACTCSSSVFSGNAAHVEFFLPKLGLACNCSSSTTSIAAGTTNTSNYILMKGSSNDNCINNCDNNIDPRSLSSILRPWQASFLESIGITTAEQLILATSSSKQSEKKKEYVRKIVKSMQQWRNNRNMKPVKTKSCYVALHIWTRTAKVTLRSLDHDHGKNEGTATTNIITMNNDNDDDDISTLGGSTSLICETKEI